MDGWRTMDWFTAANIVVCSVVSVVGLATGHISTAVWFAGLAAFAAWVLIRRRRAARRPAQNWSQLRSKAVLLALGLVIFSLGTAIVATISVIQDSGGDRVFTAILAAVLYVSSAVVTYTILMPLTRSATDPGQPGSGSENS